MALNPAIPMMTRLFHFSFLLVLILLPVAGVPISIAGIRVPLIAGGLVPLVLFSLFTLPTSPGASPVFSAGLPFWLGLGVYLAYLGIYAAAVESETSVVFFVGRLGILYASYLVGVCTYQILMAQRLERTLAKAAFAGLLVFVILFSIGSMQAGYTPGTFADAAVSLNISSYMRMGQHAFSVWAPESRETASNVVPVLKNAMAEGTASLLILLLIAMILQTGQRTFLNTAALFGLAIIMALTLSRSVAISCLCAVMWLSVPHIHKQILPVLTGVFLLALLSLIVWMNYHNEFTSSAEAFIASRERSTDSRIDQIESALRHQHSARYGWLFGDGPFADYGGVRIHNILLSAWVEGGLLAIAAVTAHALPVLLRLLSSLGVVNKLNRRNAILQCGCAIPVLVGLRTLTNGSGGFYSIAGLLAMGCFWGICAGSDEGVHTGLFVELPADSEELLSERTSGQSPEEPSR